MKAVPLYQSSMPSLKSWKDDIGFVVPESETMPVCLRGFFVAKKKQFFNQPEESWKKMEASLSRANNIIEGHYAERMWASIFLTLTMRVQGLWTKYCHHTSQQ